MQISVVYTMGKVASTSVSTAIKRANLPCYDIHSLDRPYLIRFAKKHLDAGEFPPPNICESMAWRDRILTRQEKCFYITLVRDPIARNLSAFFQNLKYFNLAQDGDEKDAAEVFARFLDEYPHTHPLTWLDREFKGQLGIDCYETPFNKVEGYLHLPERRTVIFRADCPDETKSAVVSKLLGTAIEIGRDNDSSNKKYRDLYARVKSAAVFPDSFIDAMYDSRYARHFWTDEECDAFKRSWRRSAEVTTA